ncbi:CRIB domain-containing protein RIC7 [Senna tora]|uniref:CRIB domain-containing protein RIC7 n=1 Tax=Senna tora TaxID=362788 RepID=A0A834SQF0_9FABA|nr:CRIB domain-containing protein RIC7 [Senna tora]
MQLVPLETENKAPASELQGLISGANYIMKSSSAEMSTKVKGLFKGLKKLNIFEEKDEEDQIEIGFPTDVKHVAHIGLDGPSASTPTWMADIKGASEATESPKPAAVNSTETNQGNGTNGDGVKNIKDIPRSKPSKDPNSNSPTRERTRPARHHRSSDPTSDSSVRRPRRHANANHGGESSSEEVTNAAAPKHHRRRKSKTTNGDGSETKTSRRTKGHSMTDITLSDHDSVHGSTRGERQILEGEK